MLAVRVEVWTSLIYAKLTAFRSNTINVPVFARRALIALNQSSRKECYIASMESIISRYLP